MILVLVLVLKDALRTYFKSLSWSLGVLVLVLVLGGQVLVLVLVLGGQVLVNIPDNNPIELQKLQISVTFKLYRSYNNKRLGLGKMLHGCI